MKLTGIILVLSVPFAASLVIDCEFKNMEWDGFFWGNLYSCRLRSDPSITERGTVVTAATGNHESSKNHASVTAFRLEQQSAYTINYMPRGLNNVFPNLIAIGIHYGHMKEIRQADLQSYPNLKELDLFYNEIETIEQDLFKYNPQLQYISLQSNRIQRVHPKVFEQLNQLRRLNMAHNFCVSGSAFAYNREEVLQLISKINDYCIYFWVSGIKYEMTKISDQVKSQNEETKNQIGAITSKIQDSDTKIDNLNLKFNKLSNKVENMEAQFWKLINALLGIHNNTTESQN
jgi:hypothetical protein